MRHRRTQAHTILRDLGDGLILRCATPDDAEALATFNAHIFRTTGSEQPNMGIAAWTQDLLSGDHPACGADDFTIVEEVSTGAIISSLVLISQTWTYEGIAFGVGRPEIVGTSPAYRRRGLVRTQFEVLHQRSAARHERMQAITGIPWYYRQFAYEMALNLGGGRVGYREYRKIKRPFPPTPARGEPVRPAPAAGQPGRQPAGSRPAPPGTDRTSG